MEVNIYFFSTKAQFVVLHMIHIERISNLYLRNIKWTRLIDFIIVENNLYLWRKKSKVDEYAIKYVVGHTIEDITESVYTERDVDWLKEEIEKIK